MAGDACIQEAGRKDLSFLGNRAVRESCGHGVAVLESQGLSAGGRQGYPAPAAEFQVRIPGKTLSEQGVVWRPIARTWGARAPGPVRSRSWHDTWLHRALQVRPLAS